MTTLVAAELAERALAAFHDGLPPAVVDEARKGLLNVLGTAIGASTSDGLTALVDIGQTQVGSGAFVPGRTERVDLYTAAQATAAAAHWEDFDDGHDSLRIHPGPASLGACLVMGEHLGAAFGPVLDAYAISCEIQFRLAMAIQPQHYAVGWHTTATVGSVATSVAVGALLGLGASEVEQAIGLAAAQAAGVRQGFGTMMKPLNAGKAAANGVLSALLARQGVGGLGGALERPGGFLTAFAEGPAVERVLAGFGEQWHFLGNTYKPYPCGRVVHPVIDAGLELRDRLDPADLVAAEIEGHPMVSKLTGIPDPKDGLETKFSAGHGLAVALVRGRAGVGEFTDDSALDPALARVRDVTSLLDRPADGPGTDVVTVRLTLRSGQLLESTVTAARGTLRRPLTFAEVQAKAELLIEPVLPGRGASIGQLVQSAERARPIRDLTDLTSPSSASSSSSPSSPTGGR